MNCSFDVAASQTWYSIYSFIRSATAPLLTATLLQGLTSVCSDTGSAYDLRGTQMSNMDATQKLSWCNMLKSPRGIQSEIW